jgi:hypothetical protein
MKLTMRVISSSRVGAVYGVNTKPAEYEVVGLPVGHRAFIGSFLGRGWRTLRATTESQGDWEGSYETAEDALRALEESDQA